MNCPHCNFRFRVLMANAASIPDIAAIICEDCAEVSLIVCGSVRKCSADEMEALRDSPAWRNVIGPAQELIKRTRNARNN
jgi:hypothetical protein